MKRRNGTIKRNINTKSVPHVTSPKKANREQKQNSFCGLPFGGNGNSGFMGILGGPGGGLPGFPAGWGSALQVSDTTTVFDNLRWYLVSNFWQVLSQAYVELGLVKTIVDVPVDDGLRGGITIKSQKLNEEQLASLKRAWEQDGLLTTFGWGAKWNRLYGGGGIMILIDDQDPEDPLDLASIGPETVIHFRAVDMWELYWDKQWTDGAGPDGYNPYLQEEEFQYYTYYSIRIHKSRVLALKGMEAPSFIRPRLRGWGVSVVEWLIRSINQYLKATDLAFEVLDEFKVDYYKIKNLTSTLLNPNGLQAIHKRLQIANWQKNYQNGVAMDAEDDWQQKQLSFAGLAETQEGIRKQVAADMRMPISKLFGSSDSKASIGTADQNDMENYNSMIESEIRLKLKPDIVRVIQIKCQQMFGFIPDDIDIEFQPLRLLSAEQEEMVKEKKFARIKASFDAGVISMEEFRDACNKGNLFDIKLDTNPAALQVLQDDKIQKQEQIQAKEQEKEPVV